MIAVGAFKLHCVCLQKHLTMDRRVPCPPPSVAARMRSNIISVRLLVAGDGRCCVCCAVEASVAAADAVRH